MTNDRRLTGSIVHHDLNLDVLYMYIHAAPRHMTIITKLPNLIQAQVVLLYIHTCGVSSEYHPYLLPIAVPSLRTRLEETQRKVRRRFQTGGHLTRNLACQVAGDTFENLSKDPGQ